MDLRGKQLHVMSGWEGWQVLWWVQGGMAVDHSFEISPQYPGTGAATGRQALSTPCPASALPI